MPAEFTRLFAERLTLQTGRKTIEVKSEMELLANHAYLAAGGTHLKVKQVGQKLICYVSEGPLVNNFKPSVSVLFESLYRTHLGNKLVAFMLSGMGRDGAVEMKLLRTQGTLCIGQSEESCTVYGMPRAAKELDAINFELSPDEMIKKMGGKVKKTA
jgi:two-component system chemotaxis response regulator CheB